MAGSILTDTKKIIGISDTDTTFDLDIITHINTVFSILQQIGVGPAAGYMIEDESDEWTDYIVDDNTYNMVRSYLFLKVRMLFDPPTTSYHIAAMTKQIEEFEFRISLHREWSLDPVNPQAVEEVDDDE